MLAPQWAHIRRASFFRGGIDYSNFTRKILLWGNFRPAPEEIVGIRRSHILATAERLTEEESPDGTSTREQVISFAGDKDHFVQLRESRSLLFNRLLAITHPKWLAVSEKYAGVEIGINVRCGKDFVDAKTPSDFFSKGAIRTPVQWYIETLQTIRDITGELTRAIVVSDGTSESLQELLALPHVQRADSKSAISDLLILAKSRILIASGGSSFSAWASFLSGAPTVTHPGQSLQWFKISSGAGQIVDVLDCAQGPSVEFLNAAEKALSQ